MQADGLRGRSAGSVRSAIPDLGEIVLIRHGQGECNAAGRIGGQRGCQGLSEVGRLQSAHLAEIVARMDRERPFTALLSTPRLRVLQCARIIGARLALPITVLEELQGQEFGTADGQQWQQVTHDFGGPPASDPDRPIAVGAESWNAYAERVFAALLKILAEYSSQRILVVAHGKTTGMAGALLSGAPDPMARVPDFILEHGAWSHWRQHCDSWQRR